MFGDKKNNLPLGVSAKVEPIGEKPISLVTMPDAFYGGADPLIYHTQESIAPTNEPAKKEKLIVKVPNVPMTERPPKPKSGKTKWIFIILGLLVIVGLASWYYINQALKSTNPAPIVNELENTNVVEEIVPTTTVEIETSIPTTTVSSTVEETPTTTVNNQWKLEFPPQILINAPDMDSDGLTDVEEEMYGTDSGAWDTDEDGYYDGLEVINLYNPKGFAPVKLIDSGVVQEYISPVWQYRLYYPMGWQAAEVDSSGDVALFSAPSGDFVEVVAMKREENEVFVDWFVKNASSQSYLDLFLFVNRFQENGFIRQDNFVGYFVDGNRVFTLLYHPSENNPVLFRQTMIMMMQSFRPAKTNIQIPEQMILPSETEIQTI